MNAHTRAFAERPGKPLCEEDGVTVYAYAVVNDVEYKLYLNRAKKWCVRVCDEDTKEWIVPIREFPTNMDMEAMAHFNSLVSVGLKGERVKEQ